AWRMSRSTSPPLARLTSARTSPVSKWTTLSISMLWYGSPQRSTGMWITGVLQIERRSTGPGTICYGDVHARRKRSTLHRLGRHRDRDTLHTQCEKRWHVSDT